jgi:hypothetical protein
VAKADYSVKDLVAKIHAGELRLPEMQRQYVWTGTRVRDLLDSLYRGYPSGVILAWESDVEVDTRDFAVEVTSKSTVRPLLLLDGQQRLTSLSAVMRGEPVTVRKRKRPIEILFNLEHPDELLFATDVLEESDDDLASETDSSDLDLQARFNRMTFVVASPQLKNSPQWVKVSDIFSKSDSDLLEGAGLTDFKDPRFEKYKNRINAVKSIADYQYRMDILERTKSYEEVTDIFVRVNSLGAKLRSSDLALAQITAKWKGSLGTFTKFQDELQEQGFDVELGIILKTMIALITDQSKFLTVNSLSLSQLESGWERTKVSLTHALNFVKANVGIDSTALLSSPFLLVTTSYWADKDGFDRDAESAAKFRQWFLVANAKGRYSRGSSETLLDQDLAVMRDGGDATGLQQRLIQQMGRLEFTPEDLIGRTSTSGAFKTMFLAFRERGAQDWTTHLAISPKHAGKSDSIEYHHIFPRAFLKRIRPEIEKSVVNDIANLAFIGASTNKKISDKAPSDYRQNFTKDDFDAQLINFSSELETAEHFEAFIASRRAAIAKTLNEFLGLGA